MLHGFTFLLLSASLYILHAMHLFRKKGREINSQAHTFTCTSSLIVTGIFYVHVHDLTCEESTPCKNRLKEQKELTLSMYLLKMMDQVLEMWLP